MKGFCLPPAGRHLVAAAVLLLAGFALTACDKPTPAAQAPPPGAEAPPGPAQPRLEIDGVEYRDGEVKITGWQSLETGDSAVPGVGILLTSGATKLTYPSQPVSRGDVAALLHNPALVHAGFEATIPHQDLAAGIYQIGVQSRADPAKTVQSKVTVESSAEPIEPAPTEAPTPNAGLTVAVDKLEAHHGYVTALGWAYRLAKDRQPDEPLAIELRSAGKTYAFRALENRRPELIQALGRPDVADAGFACVIDARKLPPGEYQAFIAIQSQSGWVTKDLGRALSLTPGS